MTYACQLNVLYWIQVIKMQLQRYLETIWLLIRRRSVTAQELADHFEVSVRTIYRDLDVLSSAGIPLYTEKGRGGGIRLMDDHVLNRTYLTDDEQKEILAALHGFNQVYEPDTPSVLNKFSALFPQLNIDWIDVDFSNWSTDDTNELFNQLKDATLNCQCLHFSYINNEGHESERNVDPYKLVFKGAAWYIYAFCHLRQDFRFFKISRIANLNVLDETFIRQPIPKPPINMPVNEKQYPYKLRIDPLMGFRVVDEFDHDAYTRDENGYFIVSGTFPDENWVIGYVMSYGSACELLEPVSLRNELNTQLKELLTKYQ